MNETINVESEKDPVISINAPPVELTLETKPLKWTMEKPTVPGWYVYKDNGKWCLFTGQVALGRWQQAQDPMALYCDSTPLEKMNALWFGPIPDPKEGG